MDAHSNYGSTATQVLNRDINYGKASSPIISVTSAPSSGAIITVASTSGMAPGMVLGVSVGVGAFPTGTIIKSITDATHLVASAIPTTTVASGATVSAHSDVILEDIICQTGATITTLEEYINGVSTDVLGDHGFLTTDLIPVGMVLRSRTGNGFSKVRIAVAAASATILSPRKPRNNEDSPNSGIYRKG